MGAAVVVAELDRATAATDLRDQGHRALVVRTDVTSREDLWSEVCGQLNSLLRGWRLYFDYGHASEPTRRLTTTSMTVSGVSWSGVTRCQRMAPAASHIQRFTACSGCFGSTRRVRSRRSRGPDPPPLAEGQNPVAR
jgi:hypothetical protein